MTSQDGELRTKGEHLSHSTIEEGFLMLGEDEYEPEHRAPEERGMHITRHLYSHTETGSVRRTSTNIRKLIKKIERGELVGYTKIVELAESAERAGLLRENSVLSYVLQDSCKAWRGGLTPS